MINCQPLVSGKAAVMLFAELILLMIMLIVDETILLCDTPQIETVMVDNSFTTASEHLFATHELHFLFRDYLYLNDCHMR